MLRTIFYVLLMSIFAIYFSDVILDSASMLSLAITSILAATQLILDVVLVVFSSMISFYYLKVALYIGLLFFVTSYVLKWITGHHLTTEEDIENEKVVYNKLNERDWKDLENEVWKIKNKDTIKLAKNDSWLYGKLKDKEQEEDIETANARWNKEYERRRKQW